MDERGPILYNHLQSSFDKLLRSLEAAGKAKGGTYQELCRARKRCGINAREYVDILTLRSARARSKTPDLQDFWYSRSLECCLSHQDEPFVTNEGGWVEEIDYLDGLEGMVD
ncbi:hypothetical protein ABW20_dc0109797 [Dactylellina cionopaga]|nr:hypothetical protein ABW20_dc0109797 [Dactylellina cionopaga]